MPLSANHTHQTIQRQATSLIYNTPHDLYGDKLPPSCNHTLSKTPCCLTTAVQLERATHFFQKDSVRLLKKPHIIPVAACCSLRAACCSLRAERIASRTAKTLPDSKCRFRNLSGLKTTAFVFHPETCFLPRKKNHSLDAQGRKD